MEHDGDKTQDPTPHRRQQARDEGQVAHSQDLGSAVLLVAACGALLAWGGSLAKFLVNYSEQQLGGRAWLSIDTGFISSHWNALAMELGRHCLPLLATLVLAGILVNLGQTGFLFLPQKIGFDLTRLDPLAALGRIFSLSNVVRLGFGIFKVGIIAVVAGICLYQEFGTVLALSAKSIPEIAVYLGQTLLWITMKIGIALVVLAVLDYGFQWWRQEQDLKMTTQEIREEMKNLEGDPQVAARRRAVQRQLVNNRLNEAVPKADAVVTNPTELAVAIQYDPKKMAAPVVVAKGAGVLAQRIRQLALQHGIPIVERKPLAQALYREVEVNRPIPPDRYAAVAELLAYVYQLKGKRSPGGSFSSRPDVTGR